MTKRKLLAVALVVALLNLTTIGILIGQISPTPHWVNFYSTHTTMNGEPIPVGMTIEAYDPDNVLCGTFTVDNEGWYGLLPVYGDEAITPEDEGAEDGDLIEFRIHNIAGTVVSGSTLWEYGAGPVELDLSFNIPDSKSENNDITYPPEIDTLLEKLAACERLQQEMIDEANAVMDANREKDIGKVRTYARMTKEYHKKLNEEVARLRDEILLAEYPTAESYAKAVEGFSDEDWDTFALNLYGDMDAAKETPTTATSAVLTALKGVDFDKLPESPALPGTEDYTTYDEEDPGDAYLTVIATKVTIAAMPEQTDAWVTDSKGAGHFSADFNHRIEVYGDSGNNDYITWYPWSLSDSQDSFDNIDGAGGDVLSFYADIKAAVGQRVCLRELDSGTIYTGTPIAGASDNLWFIDVDRDDDGGGGNGLLTIYVATGDYWDDGGTQVGTNSINLHDQEDPEFVGFISAGTGGSGNMDGYVQNLDLGEGGAPAEQGQLY